jgi:hypothetical protein
MLSKNGAQPEKPSNKPKKGEGDWWSLTLSAADTDTCGRFELFDPGKEFMVVSANYYDSTVLGADYLEVDVKQVASTKGAAESLANFAVAGYDADKQTIRSIAKIETVGRVVELVNANIVSVLNYGPAAERLRDAFDERTGYNFAKCSLPEVKSVTSIVGADVRAIQGKGADKLYAAFCGDGFDFRGSSMPVVGVVEAVVGADLVSICGNLEAADGLLDFAWVGYDAEQHAITRVAVTDVVMEAYKPLTVNVTELYGNRDAALHLSRALSGEGYNFKNCSLPDVKHISEVVAADVQKLFGEVSGAANLKSAFTGEGYHFPKCTIPQVEAVLTMPALDLKSIAGDTKIVSVLVDFLTHGYDTETHEINITLQAAQAPAPVSGGGDLTSICGDTDAARNFLKAFNGDGWDWPGCVMDVRVKGGGQRLRVESIPKGG